jgi:hypothetical protein
LYMARILLYSAMYIKGFSESALLSVNKPSFHTQPYHS